MHALVIDGGVLGEDGDAALFFQSLESITRSAMC